MGEVHLDGLDRHEERLCDVRVGATVVGAAQRGAEIDVRPPELEARGRALEQRDGFLQAVDPTLVEECFRARDLTERAGGVPLGCKRPCLPPQGGRRLAAPQRVVAFGRDEQVTNPARRRATPPLAAANSLLVLRDGGAVIADCGPNLGIPLSR